MAVRVAGVEVQDAAGARWYAPIRLRVLFDVVRPLADDVEWELSYLISDKFPELDQVLARTLVGPLSNTGTFATMVEAEASPDYTRMQRADFPLGAIVLRGLYRGREFFRVGYFIHNVYPPGDPDVYSWPPRLAKVTRTIFAAEPHVRLLDIDWD